MFLLPPRHSRLRPGPCLVWVALLAWFLPGVGACAAEPKLTDVFVGGREGYPAYRIPSLVATPRGTLLAFAEGRSNLRDHAENDIVLKRSRDGGATWTPLQVVAEDGANALNNPTAVVLRESERVLLLCQRYAKGFDEHNAEPGIDGPHSCRTLITHSDDEGVHWSIPRDITAAVKRPILVTSTACGPGIGIQLRRGPHAGRILVPFNQGPYGRWQVYAAYSDDQGVTWRYGQTAPAGTKGFANEVQFAELADGSILLNARNQDGLHLRKFSISRDGGESWSVLQDDPALLDPPCQASLLRHAAAGPAGREILLFSNPAAINARTNGTVRLSRDDGRSWAAARILYPGSFAYSCMASLPDDMIGCLFERDAYQKITFTKFSVAWVEGQE